MSRGAGLVLALVLGAAMTTAAAQPVLPSGARATPLLVADLPGWSEDDHAAAFAIFARGCQAEPPLRQAVDVPAGLKSVCAQAVALAQAGTISAEMARRFFETRFTFWRLRPAESEQGFMTGYFEPEFKGSLARSEAFPTPLYGRPADLVTRLPGDDWPGIDPSLSSARRVGDRLSPYPDRTAIETGAFDGQNLEILWMRDPVDRFVLQVQGSGRIRLPDGSTTRLVYAGRNGHPYTSLGRVLSQREAIPPEQMTMDRLVARLKADPDFARDLIRQNRSFVFFERRDDIAAELGPIGGAGLPLTPLRSIAIDRTVWPYGLPAWIDATLPDGKGGNGRLARLMIAQDTGSAIVGPARVDLFVGSGAEAGHRAGLVRHGFDFTVLWPRDGG